MAKQLNIDLKFSADTKAAEKSIKKLNDALSNIANGNLKMPDIDAGTLSKASQAAKELKFHLDNAINSSTGKLDLSKLNASLKQAGTSLSSLTGTFGALGSDGAAAFNQVAQAISQAEVRVKGANSRMQELLTTFKNTARFQLTSTMLHGLMSGIQSAISYAENLNESLNNIRIRTGDSTEKMAQFAEYANKAAKELGTTTNAYLQGALTFYQQGLDDKAVKERTEIVLKMANVTKDSAQTVAEQLTSVWNNFDKTGEKLEYVADVMNALGAATASSTSEIATGLQKFAATAQTVGVSYEYAASALATLTASTRESADTVGTSLKTLFARIEGLSLGKTEEDGTNLNKYSAALAKVGVNIKDASGQLKSMDTILNEMGSRWQTLSKDTQIALAQTVAGRHLMLA